jgi:hypothetical protein
VSLDFPLLRKVVAWASAGVILPEVPRIVLVFVPVFVPNFVLAFVLAFVLNFVLAFVPVQEFVP